VQLLFSCLFRTLSDNLLSKDQKQLERFLSIPADYSWDELVTLVGSYGFDEDTKSGGSRRCFISAKGWKMFLHKPHPGNIVKRYAIRQVKDALVEFGLIADRKAKDAKEKK